MRHLSARAASDLADWLVHLEVATKADRTLYAYMRYVAALLRAFPDKQLHEFTHHDINYVLAKVPRQSRHINRSVYNQFFAWAYVVEERIDRNPVDKVPKIPAGRRRPKDIYSEAEIARLEALPIPDGPLAALMFGSGARRIECRSCQLRSINQSRARMMVEQSKGHKDRIIPLPKHVIAAVADLELFERLEPTDHLWYSTTGHGKYRRRRDPISDTTFDRWWHKVVELAGVRYLNPHQTRHTYAWLLRTEGFVLEERKLLLGHEKTATTEMYGGDITVDDVAQKVTERL